jgi:transcriptional regulator with XRE-family HTH domain
MATKTREPSADAQRFTIALGAQIRAEAAYRRISITRLAREVEIDRSTLTRYLDGKREMPLSLLYDIGEALGVPAQTIMHRTMERMDP